MLHPCKHSQNHTTVSSNQTAFNSWWRFFKVLNNNTWHALRMVSYQRNQYRLFPLWSWYQLELHSPPKPRSIWRDLIPLVALQTVNRWICPKTHLFGSLRSFYWWLKRRHHSLWSCLIGTHRILLCQIGAWRPIIYLLACSTNQISVQILDRRRKMAIELDD